MKSAFLLLLAAAMTAAAPSADGSHDGPCTAERHSTPSVAEGSSYPLLAPSPSFL